MQPDVDAAAPLTLDEVEQELVGLELDALLPALSGDRRARFEALADAVDDGAVPPDLQPQLESLVSLALQTARARTLYRAEGEGILTRLYQRTPGGRELTAHLGDVNTALRAVAGHTLNRASVGMRTLGHFTVTLDSEAARIVLAVRPEGVTVESVAVN